MPLVLASASPRRQELLRAAGITFTVKPANVPEQRLPAEPPTDYAERLARDKARAVWKRAQNRSNLFVLGADTIVLVDSHVLEKPATEAAAVRMLRQLSGKVHCVITSVCLIGPRGQGKFEDVRSEITRVCFQTISEAEIREYVATGEPMDKAGAYAIQGIASRWIPRIEGCYFNVVGLPISLVYRMLQEHSATKNGAKGGNGSAISTRRRKVSTQN
jgi:septum formation protein